MNLGQSLRHLHECIVSPFLPMTTNLCFSVITASVWLHCNVLPQQQLGSNLVSFLFYQLGCELADPVEMSFSVLHSFNLFVIVPNNVVLGDYVV